MMVIIENLLYQENTIFHFYIYIKNFSNILLFAPDISLRDLSLSTCYLKGIKPLFNIPKFIIFIALFFKKTCARFFIDFSSVYNNPQLKKSNKKTLPIKIHKFYQ